MSRLPILAQAGIAVLLCALAAIVSSGQEQEPRVEATGPAGPAAAIERVEVPQAVAERPADVVLLLNGRVLKGWTRREGDSYVVERPGSEMRLAASSVEMVGRSLEELYARRRQQIAPDDIPAHLALVHWCLRHDLLDEARLELAAVMAQEPDNTVAKQLLLRLQGQERLSQTGDAEAIDALPGEGEPNEPTGESGELFEPLQGARNRVAARELVDEGPSAPPYEWPGLPERAVSEFARTIQPLLNNSCTTGGCHSAPDREGFGLIRIRDPRLVTRNATQSNLASVLEWIDPDEPNNSEFLAMAVLAHAPGLRPQFTGLRGKQFDALARWIDSLEPEHDGADWAVRRPERPTPAFQAAMRADAVAPGRQGSHTGRRLPRGETRSARVVGAAAEESRVQTRKPSEVRTPEEGLPAAERADTPRRGPDASIDAVPSRGGRRGMAPTRGAESDATLRPGPGSPVVTGATGAVGEPRRESAGDGHLPSGPLVPGGSEAQRGEAQRKAPLSGFLRRLNPFRRKR